MVFHAQHRQIVKLLRIFYESVHGCLDIVQNGFGFGAGLLIQRTEHVIRDEHLFLGVGRLGLYLLTALIQPVPDNSPIVFPIRIPFCGKTENA